MYNPKVSATSSRSFVGELLKHIPCNVENHEACWGKVVSPKKASPKRVSEDRLTFNITAVIKRTHQACYQILSSCSLKRWTYPFKSMKRICGCVEIYSTVGVRVPICRLTMLLNKWTTSFFPLTKKKEKKKALRRMNDWLGADDMQRHFCLRHGRIHTHTDNLLHKVINTFCMHKVK